MADEKKIETPVEEGSSNKNKKIKSMNLKEIDEALEKSKKNQGGFHSKYALELLKRKEILSKK